VRGDASKSPHHASTRRIVTDHLDIVAIRIQNERAVIVFVIMRPRTGLTVIATACRQRSLIERID
jgi:hypothetical protein